MIEIPDKNTPGIYALLNIEKGKCYIGKTKNIGRRITQHIDALERYAHKNIEMQTDYAAGDKFKLTILNEYPTDVESTYLDYEEAKYIALYESHKKEHGYNTEGILNSFSPAQIARMKQAEEMSKIIENIEARLQKTKDDINQYLYNRPINKEES